MASNNLLAEVAPLRAASRQMVRELGFLGDGFDGVSAAQCHALLELEQRGSLTSGELAEILSIDKSTASRTVRQLGARRWAKPATDAGDRRRKPLALTPTGRDKLERIHESANRQVEEALELLNPKEREAVLRGVSLYARALARRRLQKEFRIRPIEKADDPAMAAIIRRVMPEFGASGPGFAINDPEVDFMSRAYRGRRARYWVVEHRGRVVGGGGFAPLSGAPANVCELRKMYFLPEVRGKGLGARLLGLGLEQAKRAGYDTCYLETLRDMHDARRLYESFGFSRLEKPKGATGHFGCDAWYAMRLSAKTGDKLARA